MDSLFSKEELEFAEEMRNFYRTEIPEEIRYRVAIGQEVSKDDMVTSQRILNKHGLAVPNWSLEYGGRGRAAAPRPPRPPATLQPLPKPLLFL